MIALAKVSDICDLYEKESVKHVVEVIDSLKVKDQTKYYYSLHIINFLEYCLTDEVNPDESVFVTTGIQRWRKAKDDFTRGLIKERATKTKKEIDEFDQGKFVSLKDCLHAATLIHCELENELTFKDVPCEKILYKFYVYLSLKFCLKSIVRPSAFWRIKTEEFESATAKLNKWGNVVYVKVGSQNRF